MSIDLSQAGDGLAEELRTVLKVITPYIARRLLLDALTEKNYDLAEVFAEALGDEIDKSRHSAYDVDVATKLIQLGCDVEEIDWLARHGFRLERPAEREYEPEYSIIEKAIMHHNVPVLRYAVKSGLSFEVALRAMSMDEYYCDSKADKLYALALAKLSDACLEVCDILYENGFLPTGALLRKVVFKSTPLAEEATRWLIAHGAIPYESLLMGLVRHRIDCAANNLHCGFWRGFEWCHPFKMPDIIKELAKMPLDPKITLLLEAGASPNSVAKDDAVRSYGGMTTVLDLARLVDDKQLVELLESYGATGLCSEAEIKMRRLRIFMESTK